MKIKMTGPVPRSEHEKLWREARKLLKGNVALEGRVRGLVSANDFCRNHVEGLLHKRSIMEANMGDAEAALARLGTTLEERDAECARLKNDMAAASKKASENEIKILRQLATEQAKSREYLRKSLALLRALILATEDGRWFSNMTDEEKAALPVTVEAFTSKHEAGGGLTASWTGSVESMASGHGRVAGNVAWQRREPNAKQE